MRFGEIDIPKPLIEAQRKNELVIFAGAGVSKALPTNLPLFGELADNVERDFRITREKTSDDRPDSPNRPKESIDEFLERVERKVGSKLRTYIHKEYSKDGSPNVLHQSLVKLFCPNQDIRIVTTNYDRMLENAVRAERGSIGRVYASPTLPLDRRIALDSIALLHGSVNNSPETLIYTAKDFADAYISDWRWAAPFISNIFAKFTVLFVGYSLGDLLLKYQLKVVNKLRPAYALCKAGDQDFWRRQEVKPLSYTTRNGFDAYGALKESLRLWASHTQARCVQARDHKTDYVSLEKELATVVAILPSESEFDQDLIIDSLRTLPKTRLFTRYARHPDWLHWLDKQEVLDPLFDPHTKPSNELEHIAGWIADRFTIEHHNDVFELIHKHGGFLNPSLWYSLVDELTYHRQKPKPESDALAVWVTILLRNVPPGAYQQMGLDYLLTNCSWPDDRFTIIALLSHLLTPISVSERAMDWGSAEDEGLKYEFRLTLRGDDYWLEETWPRFREHIAEFWKILLPTVQKHLTDAHHINISFGKAYDVQSFWRSAIERHEQDEDNRRSFDILIDVARDILEYMLTDKSRWQDGKRLVESWFATDVTLLQRIAIHGVAFGNCWTPDTKIRWLLRENLVYEHRFKHEVFQVIKKTLGRCSDSVVSKLVEAALTKDAAREVLEEKERIRAYERFNLISWMSQHAPESSVVRDALQEIMSENPDFKRREYPDLDAWSTGAFVIEPESPIGAKELVEMALPEAAKLLVEYKGKHPIRDEEDRRGLLETLTEAVVGDFVWSMRMAPYLIQNDHLNSDIWYHLIRGWTRTTLSEPEWETVLEFLTVNHQLHLKTQAACELLENAAKKDSEIPDSLLGKMESLSDTIWDQLEQLPEGKDYESGWLTKAINHGAGKLCEFWIQALHRRFTQAKNEGRGLPQAYAGRFGRILEGESYSAGLARCVLASRTHYLSALDDDWTKEHLLPQFDYELNKLRADQAWHGFLMWGKISGNLIGSLKRLVAPAVVHLTDSEDRLRENLFRLITDLMIRDSRDKDPDFDWFYRMLGHDATTEDDRRKVIDRIWLTLREADDRFTIAMWTRWLKQFWADRIANNPKPLSAVESNRLIECTTSLVPVFSEAVDLACETYTHSFEYTHLYSDLADSGLVETNPKDVVRLLVHLLKDSGSDTIQRRDLKPLFETLAEVLEDDETLELKNILVKLGVISAV